MKKILFAISLVLSLQSWAQEVTFTQPRLKDADEKIVYAGLKNEFIVAVPAGFSLKTINTSLGEATLTGPNRFVLKVAAPSSDGIRFTFTLQKNNKATDPETYPVTYSIMRVPDIFSLRLGTITHDDTVAVQTITSVKKLSLDDETFRLKHNCSVKECLLMYIAKGHESEIVKVIIKGDDIGLNKEYQALMKKLSPGDRLVFRRIVMIDESGTTREAKDLSLLLK